MKLTSSWRDCSAARSRARDSARVRRVSAKSSSTASSRGAAGASADLAVSTGVPLAESETSWCKPAPTRREACEMRRTTSRAPSAASSNDVRSAIRMTNES